MMVLYFMKMDNNLRDLSKFIRQICIVTVLILVIFGAYIQIGMFNLNRLHCIILKKHYSFYLFLII